MNYHKDIKLYLTYDFDKKGFVVKKNFTATDDINEFEFRNNHVIVLDNEHNKILVKHSEIGFLLEEKIVNSIPLLMSPSLPFYVPSLITCFNNIETYFLSVTLDDITAYNRRFTTPSFAKLMKSVVFPLYGKIVTSTPDRFIIRIPSGDRISVKRSANAPFSLNDDVSIGINYVNGKANYVCLFCNVSSQETSFKQGDLSIFKLKFKDVIYT